MLTLPCSACPLHEHTACPPQASLEDSGSSAAASAALQQEPAPLRKGSAICALEQELLSASGAAAAAPAERQQVPEQAVQPKGLSDVRASPRPAEGRPGAPAASAGRAGSSEHQSGRDPGPGGPHRARAAGRLGGGSAPIARYLGVQPEPVHAGAVRDHGGSLEGRAWRREEVSTHVDGSAWGNQAGAGRQQGAEAGEPPRNGGSAWGEGAGLSMQRRAVPDQAPAPATSPPAGGARAAPLRPRRLGRPQAGPVAHALAKPTSEQTAEYRRKASISAYFGGGASVPARSGRVRPGERGDAAALVAAVEQGWAAGHCDEAAAVADEMRELQSARKGASIFGSYKAAPVAGL